MEDEVGCIAHFLYDVWTLWYRWDETIEWNLTYLQTHATLVWISWDTNSYYIAWWMRFFNSVYVSWFEKVWRLMHHTLNYECSSSLSMHVLPGQVHTFEYDTLPSYITFALAFTTFWASSHLCSTSKCITCKCFVFVK